MKRKRRDKSSEVHKRPRVARVNASNHVPLPLLRQYYPHVATLRQFLATRSSVASKKRRRKIQQFGLQRDRAGEGQDVTPLADLLDTTLVGSFDSSAQLNLEGISKDISVFTQQVNESNTSISPTQGALKQSEIVDFVIWQLFRKYTWTRRPPHILCHGYQRTASNGSEAEIVPGIPGVLSTCHNAYVESLKGEPWTALPALLGSSAERILSDLFLDCGIFSPVGENSNLRQLSGTPMSELKLVGKTYETERCRDKPQMKVQNRPVKGRGHSDIRFVRHRMLYARPSQTTKGRPRFGLPFIHILNRLTQRHSPGETLQTMKYIFPRQFGLHNAFTSTVNPNDSAQAFKDYTLRDKEIAYCDLRKDKRRQHKSSGDERPSLPKRLRGKPFELIQRVRKRHLNCAYHALLQHYCPLKPISEGGTEASVRQASSVVEVSAYCRAVAAKVFPHELWAFGEAGAVNRGVVYRAIDRFVRLRRYESMSLHEVLQPLQLTCIDWLAPPNVMPGARISKTDYEKRKELMAELLYYVFDSFLIPLIRGTFHVTESNVHRNQLFYFRHDIWKAMAEPALTHLKTTMFEECSAASVKRSMVKRALGVSQVRLLPKEQGMRPIINLRRRVQKVQYGQMVLGRSINSILTPVFSVLNYEKASHPQRLGSALFSVDDIFPRLQAFRDSIGRQGRGDVPLYFAKVDVQACFDTIPQHRLMGLAKEVIRGSKYLVSRFSRAKLVGDHNHETPGFGAKPSWKFATKAGTADNPKLPKEEAEEALAGRTRSIYVDGVVQKSEGRQNLLELLEEHVESNLIRVGNRFYRQKAGIPQGSIVSSLLCSYIYAELERETLKFLHDGRSLLLRLIDDFLVISTRRDVAERFMQVMHHGIPDFGVNVKMQKSCVNFDMQINGGSIPKLPARSGFPYCGNVINTVTLDISKDQERHRKSNIADSMTVEYTRLPGQTFYRKTMNSLKLQMHAMLLSTNYNSHQTVYTNLYHSFIDVAQKSCHYIRSLPLGRQPSDGLIISK